MKVEPNLFIKNIAAQFDGIDPKNLSFQTRLDEIGGWDSLTALSILTMVEKEYGVSIEGEDIMENPTIEDLYNTVKSRYFRVLP